MPTCLAVSIQKHYHCFIILTVRWIFLYLLEVTKISKAEGSQALMGFPNSSQWHKFLPEIFWQSKRHFHSKQDVFALNGIGCSLSSQTSAVSASNYRDHEFQQFKLEVCKTHLTITRLSQKCIKQSVEQIVSSTLKTHGSMREVSPWCWGFVQLHDFTSLLVQVQESATQMRSFVPSGRSVVTQAKPQTSHCLLTSPKAHGKSWASTGTEEYIT